MPSGGYGEKNSVEEEFSPSLTPNAIQKNWKTPNEFPKCPKTIDSTTLSKYEKNLNKGDVFSKNKYRTSIIEEFESSGIKNELVILTSSDNPVKPFALAKVYINDSQIVHESVGSFLKKNGAQKEFYLLLGKDWEGGETIDDYAN